MIHEQSTAKPWLTVCGMTVYPFTQTTTPWMGEKPTCPECRKILGLPDANK